MRRNEQIELDLSQDFWDYIYDEHVAWRFARAQQIMRDIAVWWYQDTGEIMELFGYMSADEYDMWVDMYECPNPDGYNEIAAHKYAKKHGIVQLMLPGLGD